jgi:hypothetical protein
MNPKTATDPAGFIIDLQEAYKILIFLHSFSNVKSHKEVVNNIEETMGKLTIFFLIIERSRSILLTNGSGFRRPKNMRILIFFLSGSHFYPINDRTTKKGLADKLLKSVEI